MSNAWGFRSQFIYTSRTIWAFFFCVAIFLFWAKSCFFARFEWILIYLMFCCSCCLVLETIQKLRISTLVNPNADYTLVIIFSLIIFSCFSILDSRLTLLFNLCIILFCFSTTQAIRHMSNCDWWLVYGLKQCVCLYIEVYRAILILLFDAMTCCIRFELFWLIC